MAERNHADELAGHKMRGDRWRETALAFELRAMRVEYVIRLLVAAGHVPQAKVDEAFELAKTYGVAEPHACRWLDGKCMDCGRPYGAPRGVGALDAATNGQNTPMDAKC